MSDYIPPELISNILPRLPVKDVLRCTAVCKSWYSLITSSSFTSLHLKLSTPSQKPSLLIHYRSRGTGVRHFSLLVQNQTLNKIPVPESTSDCKYCYIIGGFNGLFLVNRFAKGAPPMLWNPSLRKSLVLPNPWVFADHCHTLGFGFLPETNDYKIVRIAYPCKHHDKVKGEVFELSTGSWRNLSAENIPYDAYGADSRQAFLKDIVHWPADSNPSNKPLIGTFNMKNDSFGTMKLPAWSSLNSGIRNDTAFHPNLPEGVDMFGAEL